MPTTKPLDISRNVRSRAWTFSNVRSCASSAGTRASAARNASTSMPSDVDAERRVADLPECLQRQRADVDRLRRDAQVVHQVQGVGRGSAGWCRSRAWSGRGPAGGRGPACRRSSRRPAGPGSSRARPRCRCSAACRRELLDPLGQPGALDAEDLGAAAVQLGARPARTACPATSRCRPSISGASGERRRGGTAGATRGCRRSWS